jgi:hypothetical protein
VLVSRPLSSVAPAISDGQNLPISSGRTSHPARQKVVNFTIPQMATLFKFLLALTTTDVSCYGSMLMSNYWWLLADFSFPLELEVVPVDGLRNQ